MVRRNRSSRVVLRICSALLSTLIVSGSAHALSKDQETCVNTLNKAGGKVAATQGKENSGCIKSAGAGKLGAQTADDCVVADTKGKVGKAEQKTLDGQGKKCSAPFPIIGFTSAGAVNAAAVGEEIALLEAIFGTPVDAAILNDKAGASCQSTLAKTYEKFAAARVKEFGSCKKTGFKNDTLTTDAGLVACVGSDAKGKVAKAQGKIQDGIEKKCGGVALAQAAPGCSAESGSAAALAACVARETECHMCLAINAMDGIEAPCDEHDDGVVNQTCRQCGNAATEAPEQCDDGGESATCDADCTLASCGDGTVNASANEDCDDSGESATCDDDCTDVLCGDNNLNESAGEVCDDGDLVDGDGCDSNCTPTACGNGVVTAGETCDDGNLVDGDGCDSNCTPTDCGNGIVTAGETCDDGNLTDDDGCDSNCTPTGCGNGVVTAGETCDDGNLTNGDGCDSNCTPTGCGNGVVTAGETCDDGNLVDGDGCDSNCTPTGCGNNVVTAPEVCDEGGETATCDDDCTLPACPDGNHNAAAGEQCDDGNGSDTDACLSTCVVATCGDGFLCSSGGCTTGPAGGVEECDNAGANSDVTPDACRTNCANPSCGDSVTDSGEFCDDGGNSVTCDADCTVAACGDGFTNPVAGEDCDDGGESASCDPDCTDSICGDGLINVTAGEECDDGNTTPGDGCNGTCLCGVGSGEVGCQDQTCPNKGELTLYAGTGVTCANNGDCAVGECDTGLGRCTTVTELDTGWTGIAHDADINDEVIVTGQLVCPGPGPTCGECAVIGLLPDGDNCRCANDSRAICDEPFVADADNCGGAICNCYFGPPLPLSAGNTPACVVNRFANDISGTANIDSGQGEITANLRSVVFTGPLLWQPCPVCGGTCTAGNVGSGCAQDIDCDTTVGAFDGVCGNLDPTPNDGIRGGRCKLGDNDGQTCDVQASHTTFPAPQGGGYSLDCFPSSGSNVSGSGLTINLTQTTGSVSLGADVVCGFPPFVVEGCHCGLCTGNTQIACASNADCSVAGGTCERRADGDPQPEQCDVAGCLDAGGGEGECEATGPIDRFCDAVLRANGEGFIGCNNNGDCLGVNIGIAAGNCTLSKIRECFLDPITATGVEDANAPVGVATFCIPTTSNGAINSVAGLPGPGRVKNQAKSRLFCANNPNNLYVPNVGCP